VYLSMQHLDPEWVMNRFPTIAAAADAAGFDLARDPIPVGPAAHYIMGGVETDVCGRSTLRGLYAAGEAACTGVHGANRLASNSLLEGLVFGARAADAMLQTHTAGSMNNVRVIETDLPPDGPDVDVPSIMWNSVGLTRDAAGLDRAIKQLGPAGVHSDLALVGYLIATAALRREESRGGQFRADFPHRDDLHWKIHVADQVGSGC
jgi:L-aspartate oxidase